ncbi:MAG: hypothetical protein R2874_12735 [Desulfobacterales bacterium]
MIQKLNAEFVEFQQTMDQFTSRNIKFSGINKDTVEQAFIEKHNLKISPCFPIRTAGLLQPMTQITGCCLYKRCIWWLTSTPEYCFKENTELFLLKDQTTP